MNIGVMGQVFRQLPPPAAETDKDELIRQGRYREQYVLSTIPTKHILADEGSYFVAQNATTGTGVAHALVTSFTNTAALFVIKNNDNAGNARAKRIYLDYMRLIQTAAPTAGVSLEFLVQLDSASRAATANNVASTPVNVNSDDTTGSVAAIQAFNAGSLTVPAPVTGATTQRNVSRIRIPTGINVIGDEVVVQFGAVSQALATGPLTAIRAAQPCRFVAHGAPVVIGPQQFCIIYRWSLTEATTAPSYEWELGWFER